MQELHPAERTGARPGGVLPTGGDAVCHRKATAGGTSGPAEGTADEAAPYGGGGGAGAGRRGCGLHGAPPQRIHHAHGLPAQRLRGGTGGGDRLGGEALCRLPRRRGGHRALVLPAHRRTRHACLAATEAAAGRTGGKRRTGHGGRHRSFPAAAGPVPQEHGDRQV